MKISRIIDGNIEEIELTDEELSDAYYEKEHLFDVDDCRQYVEEQHACLYGGNSLKGSLLDHYFDQKEYETFIDEMAYAERTGIDKIGLNDLYLPTLMEEVFWDTFESMNKMEMPDNSVSIKGMFEFGYTYGGILPISSQKIALELFDKMEVFELNHNGSERLIESENNFDGFHIYGVRKADWEKYLQKKTNSESETYNPDLQTILQGGKKFCYMFLDRLRSDCNYFLGCGNANEKSLWTGDVNQQIHMMEDIYTTAFTDEEKPQWISLEQIREYRVKMLEALKNKTK